MVLLKVSLAVFRDKKLLVVRNRDQKDVFFCLGGQVETSEDDVSCLVREVREEIGCEVDLSTVSYLTTFETAAHGRPSTRVRIKMYQGEIIGDPTPSGEVVEIKYFDTSVDKKHLSEMAVKEMFPWLKDRGFIA